VRINVATATAIMLFAASSSAAAVRAAVTAQELAAAINKADAELVPYRTKTILPHDIRTVRCIALVEEPTEIRCRWQQRFDRSWVERTTWLAIDRNGWQVMDA
jgi:hypothetical protein